MTHPTSSISHSFLENGTQAIDTTHTMERRLAEAEARRIHPIARESTTTGLRHLVGSGIIALGTLVAGTTTTIQDRQATMPAPAPESGLVPTR